VEPVAPKEGLLLSLCVAHPHPRCAERAQVERLLGVVKQAVFPLLLTGSSKDRVDVRSGKEAAIIQHVAKEFGFREVYMWRRPEGAKEREPGALKGVARKVGLDITQGALREDCASGKEWGRRRAGKTVMVHRASSIKYLVFRFCWKIHWRFVAARDEDATGQHGMKFDGNLMCCEDIAVFEEKDESNITIEGRAVQKTIYMTRHSRLPSTSTQVWLGKELGGRLEFISYAV